MVKLANKRAVAEIEEQATKVAKRNGKNGHTPKETGPTEIEQLAGRPVVYPELRAEVYCVGGPNGPIYAETMAEWLGWELADKNMNWGAATLLTLPNGQAVRCLNNLGNRPFYETWMKQIAQDMLMKKFGPKGPNGETIIIGRTGRTLSAQHRGTALMYAQYLLDTPEGKAKYGHLWPDGRVYIESFVAFGVDESPETVVTLDNTKSRTGADCLYTSPHFQDLDPTPRRACCRIVEDAAKVLWERMGIATSVSALPGKKILFRRTPSEVLNFLDRHPTLGQCARVIYAENGEQKALKKYMALGSCTAAMYLMATSESDLAAYADANPPSEASLDLKWLGRAESFWRDFAQHHPFMAALWNAYRPWLNEEVASAYYFPKNPEDKSIGNWAGTLAEKLGLFAMAWTVYKEMREDDGEKITTDQIQLSYVGEEPEHNLQAPPTFGGIDLGDKEFREEEEVDKTEEEQENEDDGVVDEEDDGEVEEAPAPSNKEKAATKKLREKVDGKKKGKGAIAKMIGEMKDEHGERTILLWPIGGGKFVAFSEDAVHCALILKAKYWTDPSSSLEKFCIDASDYPALLGELGDEDYKVLLCHDHDGEVTTEDAFAKGIEVPPPAAEPEKPASKKPAGARKPVQPGAKRPIVLKGGTGK